MDHFEAASPIMFRQRELFKIMVSESRLRHRELRNKGNLIKELGTGDILVVRKQVKSRRKNRVDKKILLKTKGPYRFLEKDKPSSYCLWCFSFCEVLGRPRRKVKKSASSMEMIPPTILAKIGRAWVR